MVANILIGARITRYQHGKPVVIVFLPDIFCIENLLSLAPSETQPLQGSDAETGEKISDATSASTGHLGFWGAQIRSNHPSWVPKPRKNLEKLPHSVEIFGLRRPFFGLFHGKLGHLLAPMEPCLALLFLMEPARVSLGNRVHFHPKGKKKAGPKWRLLRILGH